MALVRGKRIGGKLPRAEVEARHAARKYRLRGRGFSKAEVKGTFLEEMNRLLRIARKGALMNFERDSLVAWRKAAIRFPKIVEEVKRENPAAYEAFMALPVERKLGPERAKDHEPWLARFGGKEPKTHA